MLLNEARQKATVIEHEAEQRVAGLIHDADQRDRESPRKLANNSSSPK